jgi:glycosyltransferase involved in cell wall biosynthesis
VIVAYNALSVRPDVADGAATFSLNLLRWLPAALPEATVVAYLRDGEGRLDGVDGLQVRHVGIGSVVHRLAYENVLFSRELRRLEADVVVAPNESLPLAPPCPVVVVAQNLVYHRPDEEAFSGGSPAQRALSALQASYYRRRMSAAYRAATAVVAVSAETARVLSLRAGLDLARTTVVHEGADSFLLPEPENRERGRALLAVAALAPYKNLELTLHLLAQLRREDAALSLDMVGGDWRGFRAVLERRAEQLGLGGAVRFHGAAGATELARLYETARLLLALSSCESFGLPIVEAMRFGLPVVAADRSSLPETAGGAAELVDPQDEEATTETIRRLLGDDAALAELVRRGRERASKLTWRRTADGIAEVIRAAVGQPRPGSVR